MDLRPEISHRGHSVDQNAILYTSPITPLCSNLVGYLLSTLAFGQVLIKFSQQMDLACEISNQGHFIAQNVPTQRRRGATASLERMLAKRASNGVRAL